MRLIAHLTWQKKNKTDTAAQSFSGDKFVSGGNNNTQEKDDVHKCNDAKPTVSLDVDKKLGSDDTFNITATFAQGSHPLSAEGRPGTSNN